MGVQRGIYKGHWLQAVRDPCHGTRREGPRRHQRSLPYHHIRQGNGGALAPNAHNSISLHACRRTAVPVRWNALCSPPSTACSRGTSSFPTRPGWRWRSGTATNSGGTYKLAARLLIWKTGGRRGCLRGRCDTAGRGRWISAEWQGMMRSLSVPLEYRTLYDPDGGPHAKSVPQWLLGR